VSQASRNKVLARERHRRQVARILGTMAALHWRGHLSIVQSLGASDCADAIFDPIGYGWSGITFDVHAARELGERMVACVRHEGAEQVVADWRESQGLRAGLPPGFPHDALRWRQHVRLGRRLLEAIKGQPSACESCDGRRTSGLALELERYCDDLVGGRQLMTTDTQYRIEREVQALVTERGLVGTPSVTLNFDTRAIDISGIQHLLACQDCRGTGHNIRGTLPMVAWPPVVLRRAGDVRAGLVAFCPESQYGSRRGRPGDIYPGWLRSAHRAASERGWTLVQWVAGFPVDQVCRTPRTRPTRSSFSPASSPPSRTTICKASSPTKAAAWTGSRGAPPARQGGAAEFLRARGFLTRPAEQHAGVTQISTPDEARSAMDKRDRPEVDRCVLVIEKALAEAKRFPLCVHIGFDASAYMPQITEMYAKKGWESFWKKGSETHTCGLYKFIEFSIKPKRRKGPG